MGIMTLAFFKSRCTLRIPVVKMKNASFIAFYINCAGFPGYLFSDIGYWRLQRFSFINLNWVRNKKKLKSQLGPRRRPLSMIHLIWTWIKIRWEGLKGAKTKVWKGYPGSKASYFHHDENQVELAINNEL